MNVAVGWEWGGTERGSKRSSARGKVSRRTAQPNSGTVIVSQVMERNGGGGWGLVGGVKTVEIKGETHM